MELDGLPAMVIPALAVNLALDLSPNQYVSGAGTYTIQFW